MSFKELKEEIESAVPISALAGSRSSRIRCPFHNSEGLDLQISHEDNKWRCWGRCDDGYWHNVFDWVMREQGCDFKEALRFLSEYSGVSLAPSKERTQILTDAQHFYHEELWKCQDAMDYLHNRGFSDEHIFQTKLGYAGLDIIPDVAPIRKLGEVDLVRSGYNGPYPTFRDRIVYPVYDTRFNQIQMQGRLVHPVEATETRAAPPKYMALSNEIELKGRSIYHCLGGEEILRRPIDHVFIAEGWPDKETLSAWRLPAVCLFGHQGLDRHALRLKNLKRVYVVLDPDEASQRNLLDQLYQLAIKIPHVDFHLVNLETNGLDLNDWAMSGKKPGQFLSAGSDYAKIEALYEMCAKSKTLVEDLITRWSSIPHKIPLLAQLVARLPDPERWVYNLANHLGEPVQSVRFLIKVLVPNTGTRSL